MGVGVGWGGWAVVGVGGLSRVVLPMGAMEEFWRSELGGAWVLLLDRCTCPWQFISWMGGPGTAVRYVGGLL